MENSYVVCAVQRSGSSFLCELLKSTKIAGVPEEYFLYHEGGQNWEAGWWAQGFGITSRDEYLRLVLKKGCTTNGIFGTKMMWNYFEHVIKAFAKLPKLENLSPSAQMATMLNNPKYIWIVRNDKVRQAVSWAIAAQTGIYSAAQEDQADHLDKLNFNFDQIDLLHRLILGGETGWDAYFGNNNIVPYKVIYEELVNNQKEIILDILEFLDIPLPAQLSIHTDPIKKQSAQINDEWTKKYLKLHNKKQGE